MSVGENIKRIRKEKGLTQKQLGDMCGLADSAIRRYEGNRANPKFETLKKIANALEVYVGELEPDWSQIPFEEISKDFEGQKKDWMEEDKKDQKELLQKYNSLNKIGKMEAQKRVGELTQLDQYKKLYNINVDEL